MKTFSRVVPPTVPVRSLTITLGLAFVTSACGPLDLDGDADSPGSPNAPRLGNRGSASWAIDTSGYDYLPNPVYASVSELTVRQSRGSSGALYNPNYGSAFIEFDFGDTRLEFRLPSVAPGIYDLSGADGELDVSVSGSGVYSTSVRGGFGMLVLTAPAPGRLAGQFEGRYCFRRTPGSNCFNFYGGTFEVEDLATGNIPNMNPPVDYGVPPDFPTLDATTAQRATWRLFEGDVREGRRRDPMTFFDDVYSADFEVSPGPQSEGSKIGLRLVSVDPGAQPFTEFGARLILSRPSQSTVYTSRIEGGSGALNVVGRNDRAAWGTFSGRVCWARTPNANCYDISDGRFSVALP